MATYAAQFGYNTTYPSANQLHFNGGISSSLSPISGHHRQKQQHQHPTHDRLPLLNENSLSPSGVSNSNSTTITQSSGNCSTNNNDTMSPGAISPTSHTNSCSLPVSQAIESAPTSALTSTTAAIPSKVTDNNSVSDKNVNGAVSSTTSVPPAVITTGSYSSDTMPSLNNNGNDRSLSSSSTTCCENGRPIMTDPVSGQTVCSCQYDSARLAALSSYSRMSGPGVGVGVGVGVYGTTAYPSNEQNPYPSISVESSAFYTPLSNPYSLKENSSAAEMSAWTTAGLQPTTSYYSYDPTFAYGYGPSYDLAARRKNATRESTATLKAWLSEHKKNPYPTKGEKIMLAIITKMTLTQVSTWFANARRRLKKENKMTWEPKNKTEDDDDAILSDDEKDVSSNNGEEALNTRTNNQLYGRDIQKMNDPSKSAIHKHDEHKSTELLNHNTLEAYDAYHGCPIDNNTDSINHSNHPYNNYHQLKSGQLQQQSSQSQQQLLPQQQQHQQQQYHPYYYQTNLQNYGLSRGGGIPDCGIPLPASKPKIWSLADTVACKTPPPLHPISSMYSLQQQQQQQQQQLQQKHQSQYHNQLENHFSQAGPSSSSYYNNNNNNNNNLVMNHLRSLSSTTNSEQQQQQQQQQLQQQQQQSALTLMSNYVQSTNYERFPNLLSNYNENMLQLQKQQQQQQQHSLPYQQCHPSGQHSSSSSSHTNRLGFPDIQPDTPPQTPPNLKLNNNHNNTNNNNNNNNNNHSNSNNNNSTNHLNALIHTLPHIIGFGNSNSNNVIESSSSTSSLSLTTATTAATATTIRDLQQQQQQQHTTHNSDNGNSNGNNNGNINNNSNNNNNGNSNCNNQRNNSNIVITPHMNNGIGLNCRSSIEMQ